MRINSIEWLKSLYKKSYYIVFDNLGPCSNFGKKLLAFYDSNNTTNSV